MALETIESGCASAFACFAVVVRLVPLETRVWPTAANAALGKHHKLSHGDSLGAQHTQHVHRPYRGVIGSLRQIVVVCEGSVRIHRSGMIASKCTKVQGLLWTDFRNGDTLGEGLGSLPAFRLRDTQTDGLPPH